MENLSRNKSHPPSEWTKWVRDYLARQDENSLIKAIEYSKQESDEIVTAILENYLAEKFNETVALSAAFLQTSIRENQSEENISLILLMLNIRVSLIEQFRKYPPESRLNYLEMGMQACQQAIEYSQLISDSPCEAFFTLLLSKGFQQLKQFEKAEVPCLSALEIYKELTAADSESYAYYLGKTYDLLGVIQKHLNKIEPALNAYLKALAIRRDLVEINSEKYLPDLAETLNNLGVLYFGINEIKKAELAYLEAIDINKILVKNDEKVYLPDLAQIYNNFAILQQAKNDFDQAKEIYTQVITIYQGLVNQKKLIYLPYLAGILNNLAMLQRNTNRFNEAERNFLDALGIFRLLAEQDSNTYAPDVAQTLTNLGEFYLAKNQFEQAEKSFTGAILFYKILAEQNPQTYLPDLAMAHNNLATFFYTRDNLIAAEDSYRKALDTYSGLVDVHPAVYAFQLSLTIHNLGTVFRKANKLDSAENFYQRALQIRRELIADNSQVNQSLVAETLINLGELYTTQGKPDLANSTFNEALEITENLAESNSDVYSSSVAHTLMNLGGLKNKSAEYETAENFYRRALKIYRDLNEKNPFTYSPYVASALNNLGFVKISSKNFDEALNHFEESERIISTRRDELYDIDLRKLIFQENYGVYNGLLICHTKLGNLPTAIEIAEESKNSSLSDHLNLQTVKPIISEDISPENEHTLNEVSQECTQKITEIKLTEANISSYLLEIAYLKEDNEINRLKRDNLEAYRKKAGTELFHLRNRRDELLDKIREIIPDYSMRFKSLSYEQILDISQLSKHAIVVFRVLDAETYIYMVFPDRTPECLIISDFTEENLRKISVSDIYNYENFKKLEGKARSIRDTIYPQTTDGSNSIAVAMKEINNTLIDPVRKLLNDKKIHNAVFISGGGLALLPIHACFDRKKNKYLLEEFNIKFATSISVFEKCRQLREKQKDLDKIMFVTNPQNKDPKKNLPHAETEVRNICEIYKLNYATYEHNLLHDKATRENVKKRFGMNFNIMHFACHGNYNWDDPFSSTLQLANEEFISLRDVMQTKLSDTDLIVLSACKTGLVNTQEVSDEHYGFPFAFIFAGIPGVWGTLWSINDQATSILLKMAYQNLQRGMEISEALRQAQIAMRDNLKYNSPYYWAGFQHYGC